MTAALQACRGASEIIGCALAVMRQLDQVWCDEDARTALMQPRSTLSVTQSKIKERLTG